jgi:hypothetical protein
MGHECGFRSTQQGMPMPRNETSRQQEMITEERLVKAVRILASIVAEEGEQYRPLLQMIECQLAEIHARKRARERVYRLSVAIGQVA